MPLLRAEPNLYPAQLLDFPADLSAAPGTWWAMYTLSRQEKALMRQLYAQQIPFYCPIISHPIRSPNGRVRTSYLPLFTNYVFVQGDDETRYRAVSTGCVARHLPIPDPARFVTEIWAIHKLIECGRPMTLESRLPPGTPVRIRSGSMAGVEGTILERRGDHRLLVGVTFMHRGVSVSLQDWDVERI
jgi:transcription antitermination factor NusG